MKINVFPILVMQSLLHIHGVTALFFQVIGVAQVINKDGGIGIFTKEDEEVRIAICTKFQ